MDNYQENIQEEFIVETPVQVETIECIEEVNKIENISDSLCGIISSTILKENIISNKEEEEDLNFEPKLEIPEGVTNSNLPQVVQRRKGPRYFQRVEDQFCETCNLNEKIKLLRCYTCKKLKCKNCAEKESQFSTKKRDQSSYICANCFENDNPKIRWVYKF